MKEIKDLINGEMVHIMDRASQYCQHVSLSQLDL